MTTCTPTKTSNDGESCNAIQRIESKPMQWEVIGKAEYDWMRAKNNLSPRPMDWQDKLVILGSVGVAAFLVLLLALPSLRG